MDYRFLALLPIAIALAAPVFAQDAAGGAATEPPPNASRPWYDLKMMPDPILDQVLLFYLSEARHGMTDIGEVLDTASRVRPEDEMSWTHEWSATAERVRAMADADARAGHGLGAGTAYLRASAYYRAALHRHPVPNAPEIRQLAEKEVSSYRQAIERLSLPGAAGQDPLRGNDASRVLLPGTDDERGGTASHRPRGTGRLGGGCHVHREGCERPRLALPHVRRARHGADAAAAGAGVPAGLGEGHHPGGGLRPSPAGSGCSPHRPDGLVHGRGAGAPRRGLREAPEAAGGQPGRATSGRGSSRGSSTSVSRRSPTCPRKTPRRSTRS